VKAYFFQQPTIVVDPTEPMIRVTDAYFEFGFPRETSDRQPTSAVSYLYVAPDGDTGLTLLTFWDDLFDQHFELMDNPQFGDDWARIIASTYPTFGRLIDNGLHDRYGEAAVVRSVDPDTTKPGWFIVARVGNLAWDHQNLETLLDNDRVTTAVRRLEDLCDLVLVELATNKIGLADRARMIAKNQLNNLDKLAALINRLPDAPKGFG